MLKLNSFIDRGITRFYITYKEKRIARLTFETEETIDLTNIHICGEGQYENIFCGFAIYKLGDDVSKVEELIYSKTFIDSWNRQCSSALHISFTFNKKELETLINKLEL